METHSMRRDYAAGKLRRADLDPDPLIQFDCWFADALEASEIIEANAMTLATVDAMGQPHARIVLLKDRDERGFRFFTNYGSEKAADIAAEARVALVFHWQALERQVRVEGRAEKVSPEESDAYFQSRPLSSRLGAWASPQSQRVARREDLEESFAAVAARFGEGPVPLPPNWGGYVVRPEVIEFWQGRRSRLHDRFVYRKDRAEWKIDRLAP